MARLPSPSRGTQPARACADCAHSLALAGEQWCRVSVGAYACADERGLAPLKAWLLGACGRTGRFFEPCRRQEPPRPLDVPIAPSPALNQEFHG